jgi:hypothetical protein
VIPVNAQGDLDTVLGILDDLAGYAGRHALEVILVVNNYPGEQPPRAIETYRKLGCTVLGIPYVWRPGEIVAFTARIPGIRAAASERVILFDADCRIPNPSALLDWYVDRLNEGAHLAYTHVAFHGVPDRRLARVRIRIHHLARWAKRALFGIPTARGSNYAIKRSVLLEHYEQGMLAEDMNVGPMCRAAGGCIAYSRADHLVVRTSARMLTGSSLSRMLRYFARRLVYNIRVLPLRPDAARFTKRLSPPTRRYVNNRPVRAGRPAAARRSCPE